MRLLVTGCYGQLGRAVRLLSEERGWTSDCDFFDIDSFDIGNAESYAQINWAAYDAVINCGAYTAVDKAETPEGRITCWRANATAPALLSRVCTKYGLTLVHISSDYVFDGSRSLHFEDEPFSPLSVYGQTKAAGDLAVACCPSHYILRSSWVIGDGKNFVKTMCQLSDRVSSGELPNVTVVDDQIGCLTFTDQMALGIFHVLESNAPYGTYNLTGSGQAKSWASIARMCFAAKSGNEDKVIPVSTHEYYAKATCPIAPRPVHSALDLTKLADTGFVPRNWEQELADYLADLA